MPSAASWSHDHTDDAYADAVTAPAAPARAFTPRGAVDEAAETDVEGFVLGPSEVVPLIYRREPRLRRAPVEPRLQPAIDAMAALPGCIAAALLDTVSERALAHYEAAPFPLAASFAAAARQLEAEREAVEALGLGARIDDIVVHEATAFHLVRPLARRPTTCLFLALDADVGDVVAARAALARIEVDLPDDL